MKRPVNHVAFMVCYSSIALYTVNVDIFACIHFRGFAKLDNFSRIKIQLGL